SRIPPATTSPSAACCWRRSTCPTSPCSPATRSSPTGPCSAGPPESSRDWAMSIPPVMCASSMPRGPRTGRPSWPDRIAWPGCSRSPALRPPDGFRPVRPASAGSRPPCGSWASSVRTGWPYRWRPSTPPRRRRSARSSPPQDCCEPARNHRRRCRRHEDPCRVRHRRRARVCADSSDPCECGGAGDPRHHRRGDRLRHRRDRSQPCAEDGTGRGVGRSGSSPEAAADRGTESAPGAAVSQWRLGGGAAGVSDPVAGTVVSATDSLSGWAGTRLIAELEARTRLQVRAVNDVHAHALGEAAAGASRGTGSSLLVAAGTGIGGGIIWDRRLVTGRNSAAGHIGHLPGPAATGLPCPCGGTGHVEAIASGPAILATYRRLLSHERPSADSPATTRDLAAAASAGDPPAKRAFEIGARALGAALGGIANLASPEVSVIGGGWAETDETWWAPLRQASAAELIPATAATPLRKAELGQDAALIGAAGLWTAEVGPWNHQNRE